MFAAETRTSRVSGLRSPRWRWPLNEMFVKIAGVQHYLSRGVSHEGEVLEAFVSTSRDEDAALKFLGQLMKRHGPAEELVTDGLRSHGAASKELGAEERQVTGRRGTSEWRTHASPSEGASAPCCGSGACDRHQSSPPAIARSTSFSIPNATYRAAPSTSSTAPPSFPSGGSSAPPETERTSRDREEFASV